MESGVLFIAYQQHVDLIFYGTYTMLFDIRLAPAFSELP